MFLTAIALPAVMFPRKHYGTRCGSGSLALQVVIMLPHPFADFASRFSRALLAAGLTQQELAERVGVTQSTVSHWFTGKRKPGLKRLESVARALGIDPAHLAFGDDSRSTRRRGNKRPSVKRVVAVEKRRAAV